VKIVCFSEIQWKYVRTRKQQILTRFPDEWDILFLSTVVAGKKNNFLPRREGRITHLCVPVMKNFPQRFIRFLFSLPPVRFIWNIFVFVWVRVVMFATGFGDAGCVFYVSNIYYARVLPWLRRSLMLYDCNDYPMGFPGTPGWAESYFQKVAMDADVVVAVSKGLVGKLEWMGVEKVHYIPNGVDYPLFRKAAEGNPPPEMRGLPSPILGYVGAIADWFDIKLVSRVSDEFPDGCVVLIGPVFDSRRRELEQLIEKRNNVHYLGPKPYQKLGAYLNSFDVSLIPLEMTELRKMADPNKLYEYSSVEKPIVTMMFSEDMRQYRDFIYLAEDRDQFIDGIGRALSEDTNRDRMREFAQQSSWQKRADEMVNLIEGTLNRQ
jgi:glycosyltransferase involved in cell wall biosynthesis